MMDKTRLSEIMDATAGDLPRAIALAHRAKADGLVAPLVHHVIAIDLKQQGRFEEAIVEAGLGLTLNPDDAGLTTTVGFCLLELDRRREAAQVFSAALKLDPTSSEASYGYGWAAEHLGALESAESGFKRALSLNPRHADALAGLAGLAARRRDWDTARRLAEQAIAIDPRQTDALTHLARVDLGQGNFDEAIRRLEAIRDLEFLKPAARAGIQLMIGDALDGAQRYKQAYDAYVEGKSALREIYAGIHARPDRPAAVDSVARLHAEFSGTPPVSWARPRSIPRNADSRAISFLVGFPRSGTTLLEQVLATHPGIVALAERPAMLDAEAQFLTEPGGITRLADVATEMLEPFREMYWKRVREFGIEPKNKVLVDKHPLGTARLPLISKMFPDAKIIFAIRDPRDVILSCFRRNFNMNAAMYEFNSIERAARYYDTVMQAGEAYLNELPLDVHRLRYEDLVADFEPAIRKLCAFLGVEWLDQLRNFADTAPDRLIATPSSTQVGRGLYDEGVDQWRRYEFALEPVLPILKPWIEKFGYAAY